MLRRGIFFAKGAAEMTEWEAASLAAVNAAPESGKPTELTPELEQRAAAILSGAKLIADDHRSACIGS